MTSLVFLFLVNTLLFLNFVSASDRFRYDSITSVVRAVLVENEHPDRPEDVDDELWSLWGNQDASMRPDMDNYVERLSVGVDKVYNRCFHAQILNTHNDDAVRICIMM